MEINPLLTEALLQYIWKFGMYQQQDLKTVAGEPLQIISPGIHNLDAGPDFTAARIRWNGIEWAGNIELHLRSSDWLKHRHGKDPLYKDIILHVIYLEDVALPLPNIPTLCLQHRIPNILLDRYSMLMETPVFVPCENMLTKIPRITWFAWLERLMIERWERKMTVFRTWWLQADYDWEAVCFRAVAQGLGFPVNQFAFEMLTGICPYEVLQKYQWKPMELSALIFGQAGLLRGEWSEEFPSELQALHAYLFHKHHLEPPMNAHSWKWLRMRPTAFPTYRMAVLVALFHQRPRMFSRILRFNGLQDCIDFLKVDLPGYWQDHYRFDKISPKTPKPGPQFMQTMILNAVLPLMYLYGKERGVAALQEKALHWADQIQGEDNKITRGWQSAGLKIDSGLSSQALIELKKQYCDHKRCLDCAIGIKLMGQGL